MTKNITQSGLIKIFLITTCLVLVYVVFYPHMPAVTQRKNMALAKEHCLFLEKLTLNNRRLEKVYFNRNTDERIWVLGFVETKDDLTALQKLVSESNPPRPVKYHVEVEPLVFEKQ